MIDRIVLDREEIAGLIRGARLLDLRVDTPPEVRERRLGGLSQREGTDAVWDVLEMLDRRELLAFSTLMASELSETEFSAQD
jgi:hypothetical protein